MDVRRLYDEMKLMAFSKSYWLQSPIKLVGNTLTLELLVIPSFAATRDWVITANGEPLRGHAVPDEGTFREVVDRLGFPWSDLLTYRVEVALSKTVRTVLLCFDTFASEQVGEPYFLPPTDLLRSNREVSGSASRRTNRYSNSLAFSISGFDDFTKLRGIATSLLGHRPVDLLDWGIGAGRVARNFETDQQFRVFGADIDPVNVERLWESGMDATRVRLMEPRAAIPFENESFDFCYGISVFTHLPEPLQDYYLSELLRILRPGGVGVFSFHGLRHFFSRINNGDIYFQWLTTGFFVTGSNHDLDVNFDAVADGSLYVDALHTYSYVLNRWTRGFETGHIVESPNASGQDWAVLRKAGVAFTSVQEMLAPEDRRGV